MSLQRVFVTFMIYMSSLISPQFIDFRGLWMCLVAFWCSHFVLLSLYAATAYAFLNIRYPRLLKEVLTCSLCLQNLSRPWFPIFWIFTPCFCHANPLGSSSRNLGILRETWCCCQVLIFICQLWMWFKRIVVLIKHNFVQ